MLSTERLEIGELGLEAADVNLETVRNDHKCEMLYLRDFSFEPFLLIPE
jgi:hypothetical protein